MATLMYKEETLLCSVSSLWSVFMIDLHGQVALVTGGAHRLGRAITLMLGQAGANVVVLLRSGESAEGMLEATDGNVLVLRVTEDGHATRRLAEEEIVCLARRVGKSTTARAWVGALIGATASLPFGISMVGDMMMPAAIAGALIAGNTGQPRARVLFDRSQLAREPVCPQSLRVTSE